MGFHDSMIHSTNKGMIDEACCVHHCLCPNTAAMSQSASQGLYHSTRSRFVTVIWAFDYEEAHAMDGRQDSMKQRTMAVYHQFGTDAAHLRGLRMLSFWVSLLWLIAHRNKSFATSESITLKHGSSKVIGPVSASSLLSQNNSPLVHF